MSGTHKCFAGAAALVAVLAAFCAGMAGALVVDLRAANAAEAETDDVQQDLDAIRALLRRSGAAPEEVLVAPSAQREDILRMVLAARRLRLEPDGVAREPAFDDLIHAMGWLSVHTSQSRSGDVMRLAPAIRFEALSLLEDARDRLEPAVFLTHLEFLTEVGIPDPLLAPTLTSFARNRPFAVKAAFLAAAVAAELIRDGVTAGETLERLARMVGGGVWRIRALTGPQEAERFYRIVMPMLDALTRGMSGDRADMYWQGVVHLLRLGMEQKAASWYETVAAHTPEDRRAALRRTYGSILIQENLHARADGDPARGSAALVLARRMAEEDPVLDRQVTFADALTASCAERDEAQALRRLADPTWRAALDAAVPDAFERAALQFHDRHAVARVLELRGNRDEALELYALLSSDLTRFLRNEHERNRDGVPAPEAPSEPRIEDWERPAKYREMLASLSVLQVRSAFRRALLGGTPGDVPAEIARFRMPGPAGGGVDAGADRSAVGLQVTLARRWADRHAPEQAEAILRGLRDDVAGFPNQRPGETAGGNPLPRLLDEELAAALLEQGRVAEGLAVLDRAEGLPVLGIGVAFDHMIPEVFGSGSEPFLVHVFPELDEVGLNRSREEHRFRRLQLLARALGRQDYRAPPNRVDDAFRALQELAVTPTGRLLAQTALRRHHPDPDVARALGALTDATRLLLRGQQFLFEMPGFRLGPEPFAQSSDVFSVPAYAVVPCSPEARLYPYPLNFPKDSYRLLESETDFQDNGGGIQDFARLHDEALETLRRLDPAAAAAATGVSVPLAELQAVLGPGEGVLVVHSSETGLVAGLATATTLQLHEQGTGRRDISDLVRTLRANIAGDDRDFPVDTAHQLYDMVVGPFAEALDGLKRVHLVWSGPLDALPPWLLAAKAPPSRDPEDPWKGVTWFADRHPLDVVVIPSIAQFVFQRSRNGLAGPAERPFGNFEHYIGLGDPQIGGTAKDCRTVDLQAAPQREPHIDDPPNLLNWKALNSLCPLGQGEDLLRLLYHSATGKAVLDGATLAESLFVGSRSSLNQISALEQGGALAKADLIVFATHGLQADEVRAVGGGLQPALLLSLPPGADAGVGDGLLDADRIASLNLANRPWVVLSACNTARSDGAPGSESLSGLSRAFLLAGARGVLASHWSVLESGAVKLLEKTGDLSHEQGLPISQALVHAQKSMREQSKWMHPRYWAAFVAVIDQ